MVNEDFYQNLAIALPFVTFLTALIWHYCGVKNEEKDSATTNSVDSTIISGGTFGKSMIRSKNKQKPAGCVRFDDLCFLNKDNSQVHMYAYFETYNIVIIYSHII